jgi:hypothetical protein
MWPFKRKNNDNEKLRELAAELKAAKAEISRLQSKNPQEMLLGLENEALKQRLQAIQSFQNATQKMLQKKQESLTQESSQDATEIDLSGVVDLDPKMLQMLDRYWPLLPKSAKSFIQGIAQGVGLDIAKLRKGDPEQIKLASDLMKKTKKGQEQQSNDKTLEELIHE